MNGMDMEQLGQQSFVYGCELKPGKDVVFNPEEDAFEHQLSLRTVSVDPTTKDELQVVEVEGCDANGQTVKTVLASVRPSCLPCVSLAGFEIAPPVVFRLKSGSGPVHLTGQHLILTDGDQSFDDDDEEEEEEEELVAKAAKRPAPTTAPKTQKKMKIGEEEDEDDDEDDDDDDDEDDDDEDDDEEEEESEAEEIPVKPKKTPAKAQPPAQNGRTPSTPAGKPNTKAKTPDAKGDKKAQTPKTPKGSLSMEDLKTKMMASVEKGVKLPNVEAKFENFLKNGLRVTDPKIIQDLWKWRQTVKDRK